MFFWWSDSRYRGAAYFRRRSAWGHASDLGYPVTPHLSLSCPMHAGNNPYSVQTKAAPEVKQAAYGETRTAIIKKKLMKNKKSKIEASAPANAVQQSSKKTNARAKINWAKRNANRVLNTDALLTVLRTETPSLFDVAEIVGKWVWIQFSEAPAAEIRRELAELGFHWNKVRQAWQHPCGAFRDKRATYDPRQKYGSVYAANQKAA
jgi:hypothetical protein